jgi:ribosomal protein L7Ae-like RNA K-turn-binding protein
VQRELTALLGLGLRARTVVVGVAGVRAALKRGRVAVVVVAENRSGRTEAKVVRLAQGMGVKVVCGPSAAELGRLSGRDSVQALGVIDPELAEGICTVSPANGR